MNNEIIKVQYDENDIEQTDMFLKKSANACKIIIKALPVVGPILGPLIDYVDANANLYEKENIKKSFSEINDKVNDLKANQKLIEKFTEYQQKEYYFLIKRFVAAIYNEPDEEYIKYLTNYLTNCLNQDYSEEEMKLGIMNKLARYSKYHIEILKSIYDDYLEENNKGDSHTKTNQINKIKNTNNIDEAIIEFCIYELYHDGFIWYETGSGFGGDKEIPYEISKIGIMVLEMLNKIKK